MDSGLQRYIAFKEAADAKSFTAAAKRLGYTQSGISRMMATLEADLELKLFERRHGEVVLTNEGERLYPIVAVICEDAKRLVDEADAIKGLECGTVRIGAFTSVATFWLPSIISDLRHEHPGIEYDIRLGDYAEIEAWLDAGDIDCGFLRLPTKRAFDVMELAEDEFKVVLPEGHELAGQEVFPIERLSDYPFMELANGRVSDVGFIFEQNGLDVRPVVSTWDDHSIMAMVESGLGIAMLPQLVLTRQPFRLKVLPLSKRAFRTIAVATKAGRRRSIALERFMDCLVADVTQGDSGML